MRNRKAEVGRIMIYESKDKKSYISVIDTVTVLPFGTDRPGVKCYHVKIFSKNTGKVSIDTIAVDILEKITDPNEGSLFHLLSSPSVHAKLLLAGLGSW